MLDPYTRDLRALRAELNAFGALLKSGTPLSEANHILSFVRRSHHLAAALGFANHALGAPDLLALERPLFGSFRCDVATGSSTARQFTLVELEDARENSVFEAVKGRDYPRWSTRFERGFSQLVDWAWRIDHGASRVQRWKPHSERLIRGFTTSLLSGVINGLVRPGGHGWTGAICIMESRASERRSGLMMICSLYQRQAQGNGTGCIRTGQE